MDLSKYEDTSVEIEMEETSDEGDSGAESTDTPKETPETSDLSSPEALEGAETALPIEAPVFTPSFKYKANREEKDMPESLKAIIKTPEDEQYWQSIMAKADGIEAIKERKEAVEQTLSTYTENYNALATDVQRATQLFSSGQLNEAYAVMQMPTPSLEQVVQGFGFNKEQVIELASQLYHLTPEQEKLQTQLRQTELRAQQSESQLSQISTQAQAQQQNWVSDQLQTTLQSPEISSIAQAFDQKLNQPGAFEQEIRQLGHKLYVEHKQIVPPQELANHFISKYNLSSFVQAPAPFAQPNQVRQAQVQSKRQLPVIPSVDGSVGSPGEREIRTMDDLNREVALLNKKRS